MSQWSEKIPKENLSKTVNSTRYLFTSFSEVWIQINNFRKSSKKFIIDLLTKNVALNLSGAIFFVGLGYSLKWWYKDQLFVVLLKQNLPALSESQQNISWETGESILNNEYQTWTPFIDRIDLYANHICVKFRQPWQKHVSERFIGVFGEPAQANISKQVLTIPFTGEKDWWKENTSVNRIINNYLPSDLKKNTVLTPYVQSKEGHALQLEDLYKLEGYAKQNFANITPFYLSHLNINSKASRIFKETESKKPEEIHNFAGSLYSSKRVLKDVVIKSNVVNKFSTYTPEKQIFPKNWFKLSPRNLCFLNQEVILPPLGTKQRSHRASLNNNFVILPLGAKQKRAFTPLRAKQRRGKVGKSVADVARVNKWNPSWGSWRSEAAEQIDKSLICNTSTDKLSYPLQLTKKLAGWQPFPNLLVLNSYLDEIPYKLENALQSYFPKKNSQLLFLSTSFRKSINSRIPLLCVYPERVSTAMNDVVIKSNSVTESNRFPHTCKANHTSVLQSKAFTHYLPGRWQSKEGANNFLLCTDTSPSEFVIPHALQYLPLWGLRNWQIKEGLLNGRGQEQKSQKLIEDLLLQHDLPHTPIAVRGTQSKVGHAQLEDLSLQHDLSVPKGLAASVDEYQALVIEELEAEGTGVKTDLLYKLKNSWVSDCSTNYKTTKTENNETEKTLDLFKETFLVPPKQSETYLKKLHLFETKKLLQNQFASLINSFSIDLVKKLQVILEKDKHSHAGDKLRRNSEGIVLVQSKNCVGAKQKVIKVVNKIVVENNKYASDVQSKVGGKDSNVFATSAASNNKSNLFETNDERITNNNFSEAYINYVNNYHHLVDVTKKVLAVKRNTQKGVILPPTLQAQYVQNKTEETPNGVPPVLTGLAELAKERKAKSVAEGCWGTEIDRLTQLFAYSTIANVADAEGLDPLLLLNTLGFTFNNFSPLTNPPILLSYDKLGVVEVTNMSKPGKESNSVSRSSSFYLNPTNLNWVVFQHSTNDKFNLLFKKIASEINKEITSTDFITSNQPITTQLTNLMFEFLKGKTSLSYVYPSNAAQLGGRRLRDWIKTNTIINKVDKFTTPKVYSSNVNKISSIQKETKIETPTSGAWGGKLRYKINVVDKDINFDKNSRYMSGYVYPDIQSNSLKAFLYQWLSKNKNLMPWFSSHYHYLNDKSLAPTNNSVGVKAWEGKLRYAKNFQSQLRMPLGQDQKQMEAQLSYANREGYSLQSYDLLLQHQLGKPFSAKMNLHVGENLPPSAVTLPLIPQRACVAEGLVQHAEGLVALPKEAIVEQPYEKCEYNVYPYGISSSGSKEKTGLITSNPFLENNHYIVNIEVPYKKFNHYLAKFPGFSDPNQFFTTLPQISCGNENLVNEFIFSKEEFQEKPILGELQTQYLPGSWQSKEGQYQKQRGPEKIDRTEKKAEKPATQAPYLPFQGTQSKEEHALQIEDLYKLKRYEKVSKLKDSINIIDKSEINKKLIQKNGCDSRKVAYSGIVVQRNKWTKDFQPFQDVTRYKKFKEHPYRVEAGASKSSIWGTLFLGPENPLTDRQCHFFGQKQLSTLDTNSLQRDYLRQLGKEILTQSNSQGYTELSKFSSIERTKILSLSKKVNSFFFKKRKYSYLLEPKDQWHLLFQEQLCTALEDCKKYPIIHKNSFDNIEKLNPSATHAEGSAALSGRIKVSAPLVMARFPKKLIQSRSAAQLRMPLGKVDECVALVNHQLEQGISWRPFCHLQRSSIYAPFNDYIIPLNDYAIPYLPLQRFTSTRSKEGLAQQSFSRAVAGVNPRAVVRVNPGAVARVNPSVVAAVARVNHSFASYTPSSIQNLDYYHISYNKSPYKWDKSSSHTYPFRVEAKKGLAQQSSATCTANPSALLATHGLPLSGYACASTPSSLGTSAAGELVQQANSRDKLLRNSFFVSHNNFLLRTDTIPSEFVIPHAIAKGFPHYPLFTERFSEEINAVPCLNKNSLFSLPLRGMQSKATDVQSKIGLNKTWASAAEGVKDQKNTFTYPFSAKMNSHVREAKRVNNDVVIKNNNLLGIQNMCTSLLIQEPLNCNSWAVLNQWVFLIALLFWVEQTLLNNVFPALFALEQILLSAAGLRTGENNRTHVLRISKNETPKFQNLAGIDGLLGELSELVLFLRGQRNLGFAKLSFWNKWNKKNSYGVLLTGSPGTGKTFLVRALANEAKVPVLILSASTLTASKLNNNKPSWSIRHAFKRAKQLAPCILFIDEIDALGKSRGKIVTDINEIVADTNSGASASASFLTHKLAKSTHHNFANQMFSYEQFGQNCSNFNATLLNKWEYPLQSTILQESNEINQNSLCQEKLVDLLKIAGGGTYAGAAVRPQSPAEFKKESTNETTYSQGIQQVPTLEKEMTRGKFGPLTQLLVSMDGVSSFSGVLIMGATNRPELLDPALTRPGRFEKIIRIDKPSEQNRIEILQLYSQNLGVQQHIPWSYLATRTIGLTTADLAVAMNYSSLRAIIQDSVHTLETIEYGLNCITRL